jgi:hypothetical protein
MADIFRTATAVTLAVLAAFIAAVGLHAEAPRAVFRIYDTASGDVAKRAAAIRTAAAIVEAAGIDAEWHDCSRDGADYPCRSVRRKGDLIVRIMPTFVPGVGSAPGTIPTRLALDGSDLQLGSAAVDPHTRTGVMATIYHDRVQTVAQRAGLDYNRLLGRAIAHEIGHLVLRSSGHRASGLMRAVWTDEELAENRPEDWLFATPVAPDDTGP